MKKYKLVSKEQLNLNHYLPQVQANKMEADDEETLIAAAKEYMNENRYTSELYIIEVKTIIKSRMPLEFNIEENKRNDTISE